MLSRRSIFSLFSAGVAIAAGAKVVAAPATPEMVRWTPTSDRIPRPSHYTGIGTGAHSHVNAITDPVHSHSFSPALNADMSRW